jgi:two-component system, NarL family, nitrate/nitrite response regulator NarL
VNVVICDDHELFAEALASLLGRRGHRVVAIPTNPTAAVKSVGQVDVDLCIMDLVFPDGCGIDGTRRVREASPPTKVLVLTGAGDDDALASAVAAGACAVVAKDNDSTVLLDAIDRAGRGEAVLPVRVLDRAVHDPDEPRDPVDMQASFLSSREREVLQLLVDGCSTNGVASRLNITYSTARTHIQNVLTKLGCHSRIEAVALAVGHGVAHPSAS